MKWNYRTFIQISKVCQLILSQVFLFFMLIINLQSDFPIITFKKLLYLLYLGLTWLKSLNCRLFKMTISLSTLLHFFTISSCNCATSSQQITQHSRKTWIHQRPFITVESLIPKAGTESFSSISLTFDALNSFSTLLSPSFLFQPKNH